MNVKLSRLKGRVSWDGRASFMGHRRGSCRAEEIALSMKVIRNGKHWVLSENKFSFSRIETLKNKLMRKFS